MDLLVVVHITSSYDSWKEVFDSNPADRATAMVQLFNVDMQKMSEVLNDPNSPAAEAMASHIEKREIYKVEQMTPPGA